MEHHGALIRAPPAAVFFFFFLLLFFFFFFWCLSATTCSEQSLSVMLLSGETMVSAALPTHSPFLLQLPFTCTQSIPAGSPTDTPSDTPTPSTSQPTTHTHTHTQTHTLTLSHSHTLSLSRIAKCCTSALQMKSSETPGERRLRSALLAASVLGSVLLM